MKNNRLIIFVAQFAYNIICVIYLRFVAKGMIGSTLIADFGLCVVNFTIMKKVIEDTKDKWLWLYYSLGSVVGTYISMIVFDYLHK